MCTAITSNYPVTLTQPISVSRETSLPASGTTGVTGNSSVSDAEMDEILQKLGQKVLPAVKEGTFAIRTNGDTVILTDCPSLVMSGSLGVATVMKSQRGVTKVQSSSSEGTNETGDRKTDIVFVKENNYESAIKEMGLPMDNYESFKSEQISEFSPHENAYQNNSANSSESERNSHGQNSALICCENDSPRKSQYECQNYTDKDDVIGQIVESKREPESECNDSKCNSKKTSTSTRKISHADKNTKTHCECEKGNQSVHKCFYTCGTCMKRFGTICKLHVHLASHSLGSSYCFDHVNLTGYPKFETFNSFAQTGPELLADYSFSVEFTAVECQTDLTMVDGRPDEVVEIMEVNEDKVSERLEQIHRKGKEVNGLENESGRKSEECSSFVKVLMFGKEGPENVKLKRKRKQPNLCTSINGCQPSEIKVELTRVNSDPVDAAEASMMIDPTVNEDTGYKEMDNNVEEDVETDAKKSEAKEYGLVTDSNPEGFCYLGGFDKKFVMHKPNLGNSCKNTGIKRNHRTKEQKESKENSRKRHLCKNKVKKTNAEIKMPVLSKEPIKRVFCKICNKNIWETKMTRHQLQHQAPAVDVMCEKCGKTCTSRQQLHKHLLTHRDTKPYKCSFCPAQFSAKKDYTVHIANHKGDRPHVCNVCDKRFLTNKSLLQHQENIHMGLTKFQCEHCERRFFKHSGLQAHLATHFDASHPCNYCDRKFRDKTSLRRHERIHTGIKMYQCHICAHAFNQCTPFFIHMEKKHGMSRAIVKEQLKVLHEANRRLGIKQPTLILPRDVERLKEELDKGGTGEMEILRTEQFVQNVSQHHSGSGAAVKHVLRKRKEQVQRKHMVNKNAATEMIQYANTNCTSSPDEIVMEMEHSNSGTIFLVPGSPNGLESISAVNSVYDLHIPEQSSVFSYSTSQTGIEEPNRIIQTKDKRIILKHFNQEIDNYATSSIQDSTVGTYTQSGYIESVSVPLVSQNALSTGTKNNGPTSISVPFYAKQYLNYTNLSNLSNEANLAASTIYRGEL